MGAGAQSAALAVTLMLASFVGPRFSFYSPFYIEPLMIFLLSAGVALIARNRFAPLLCLIPVGMLQRPQVALLGVCSLVADWQARRLNVRRLLGYAATFAVAGFVNLGLERMIQPSNEYAGALPSMWGVASMLVLDPETAVRSLLEIGIAVGALAVAVAFLPEGRRFFVRHRWAAAYLIAIGGSLLGGADKGRLAFAAAPVLALALAIGLSGLSLGPRRFAALAAVLLAGHLVTQAPWTDLTSAPAYLDSLVPTSAPNFRPGAIGLRLLVGNTVAIVGILLAGARAGTPGD
jgi:hypothetical protein